MPLRDECEWFDSCEADAYAFCAHPDKGVIPVCASHVSQFRLSPITFVASSATTSKEN